MQIREELRLHSFCKIDGEGDANCVSKLGGIGPL